jgi:glucose/arabinose dehydrogenase
VRSARTALLVAALAAACGGAAPARTPSLPAADGGVRLVRVADGFSAPVAVVAVPGAGRAVVVEQTGTVRPLMRGRPGAPALLDLRDAVRAGGEQGLLAIAFHPRYPDDPRLFASYTDRRGDSRVDEYRVAGGRALPSSRRRLLRVDQPYPNHNGGHLVFAPDGRLLLGLGDGGDAFDPEGRSQDLRAHLGKLLAIDVDAAEPAVAVLAYGLRNPWRFSFDEPTGDLWIADVGQDRWEEVNVLRGGPRGRPNLGWDAYEGRERRDGERLDATGRLVAPVFAYAHDQGCSITGGMVVRGGGVPALEGRYLFGDYCSGRVWSLDAATGSGARRERFRVPALTSFARGPRGEVLAVSGAGAVYELRPRV